MVGLGNPGKKYADTRHNIGFAIIDRIADLENIDLKTSKFESLAGRGQVAGVDVHLLKPMTYMNASGTACRSFVDYYKIQVEDLLVIHDELDLPVGRIKIKVSGSAAGHNGVQSVIDCLGEEFTRLRIGIGPGGTSHVLSPF